MTPPEPEPPAGGDVVGDVLTRWPAPTETKYPGVWRWWTTFVEWAAGAAHTNAQEVFERARIYLSLMAIETGWTGDEGIVGDNGHSVGLFQLHDAGAGFGLTVEQRRNPQVQLTRFVRRELDRWFDAFWADGLKGPVLAVEVGRHAERPLDPDGEGPRGPEAYGHAYRVLTREAEWQ